jgi:uncharacterized protein YdhG (YjbR/CyaY superfamily)
MAEKITSVDEYISSLPEVARDKLEEIRQIVHDVVPDVGERISYQIPAFTIGGRYLVYAGAWKTHVGIYPVPGGDPDFDEAMAPYRSGQGTLRFPLDQPLPRALIEDVVRRLHEGLGAG